MDSWESEYIWAIDQVKTAEGTKKKYILYAIEQCVIGQVPREKISAKLKKDLEGIADPKYIEEICSTVGATNLNYARKDNLITNPDGTVMLKRDGNGRPLPDGTPPNKRDKTEKEKLVEGFEAENKPLIEHYQAVKAFIEETIDKLKKKHFLSVLAKDADGMKTYDEYIHVARASIEFAKQAWDDRNTVPIPTQFKLHELVSTSTIKHGAKLYLGWIKEYSKISSKQVTKILLGKTRDVSGEYEPETEQEAHDSGFLGERCPNPSCLSFRVKLEHGWAHCYACELDYEHSAKRLGTFKDKEDESDE